MGMHNTAYLTLSILMACSAQGESRGYPFFSPIQQCGKFFFNVNKYTCCSRNIHEGSHLACCGSSAYNDLESSCCKNEVTHGVGQAVSDCCGFKAYNPVNQICCGELLRHRPGAKAVCCGSEAINEETHLCCAESTVRVKTTAFHRCCGRDLYDNRTQCCSISATVQNSTCSPPPGSSRTDPEPGPEQEGQAEFNQQRETDTEAHTKIPLCCSTEYDKHTHICCSGKLFGKKSGLTQCCGAEVYQLWEEGALCCDGVLYRDQPAGSVCAGKVAYRPLRYTMCHGHAHLPPGQHCCGSDPFDPHKEMCCSGHRHSMLVEGVVCCGSDTYSPSTPGHKCCSGHLHDLTGQEDQSEAECCGPLLLKKHQQCCHSTERTLAYEAQDDHSCCGHWYYNRSLWGCCAGQLAPLTSGSRGRQRQEFKLLRPLSDYNISAICREKVLLGTVVSEAVNQTFRSVVLTDVLHMWNATLTPQRHLLEVSLQDHCSFPLLEPGRTYLWRINDSQYELLTDITAVPSPLHSILTQCLLEDQWQSE